MALTVPQPGVESHARPPELRLSKQERNRLNVSRHIDKDPEAYRARCRAREQRSFASDPVFRECKRLRNVLRYAMSRLKSGEPVGFCYRLNYQGIHLREHMERQWQPGMSWENYGSAWTVDHVVPVRTMVESGVTEPHKIHALENIRPMWAFDNGSKGKRDKPSDPIYSKAKEEYTGEKHHLSKLTESDVATIKRRIDEGKHGILKQLAREYGVAMNTIVQIRDGKTWKGVDAA